MGWTIPKIWEGGDVWILGGGPSVAEQFDIPKEVVQAVKAGTSPLSVYSDYMQFLHDKHVIGVNVVFLIGDWMDIVFFGDGGFFQRYKEQLAAWKGLKVCCHQDVENQPWVKFVEKDRKHSRGISTRPDKVSWNGNSGSAAISIAAWAGAKRIFLLGFDMTLGPDQYQHFHNQYNRGPIVREDQIAKLHFGIHLLGFPEIARDAKKMNIEIINVSPTSQISEFRKISLKELL